MTTRTEEALINRILDRACRDPHHRLTLELSLRKCHEMACPLRLEDMAEWPHDSDLIHDVYGIHRHLSKNFQFLTDCFSPRFARD